MTTIAHKLTQSSLGTTLVAASNQGLCAVLFGDDETELVTELKRRFPEVTLDTTPDNADDFDDLVRRVVSLVDRPSDKAELPLDLKGTEFQRRVWAELMRIPAGQTVSYLEIAERIGAPSASRAVAGACAANHVAVVIPCHRVVRQDGSLSGYRWGVARKKTLLDRERVN